MGLNPTYQLAAQSMGKVLAQQDIELVYGGGNVGLMGEIADATISYGGKVIGVIPEALIAKEIAHTGLTKLHVVSSMHERKALMSELSDAFIALPGGYGTFEEFCEMLTWTQLGLQQKPCGLLNIEGYYDHLIALFDRAVSEQFLRKENRLLVLEEQDPLRLLALLTSYQPIVVDKWIERKES